MYIVSKHETGLVDAGGMNYIHYIATPATKYGGISYEDWATI